MWERHGKRGTPEYTAWHNMKARCLRPSHPDWARYGGRGITVCKRWLVSFPDFLLDMDYKPFPWLTLERRDNDGDYTPENCYWADFVEQAQNRTKQLRLPLKR